MASTFSTLKIELIGTGEQSGTWGTTTNTNLGTAIEEAIVGSADVAFSSSDVTLTLTDVNTTQAARHVRLNLTGTSGGARNLILGSGCQIDKPYLINNGLADTVTVKNTTGTGIAVPSGKSMWVFNDGTNVVDAVTHLTSLTLGSALPVASGGTGITSFGTGVATWLGTPSSANLAAAVTDETGSGALVFATSPTLTTPNLGTPSAITLTNASGLPLSTGVTGTLPIANGGTGANLVDPNADRILFWDDSSGAMAFLTAGTGLSITGTTLTATGSGGTVTSVSGTGTVNGITLTGTVTSSGSLTLGGTLSNVSLTTQVTGTLPAGNGGTGITSLGSGIATWLGTPSSTNLRSAVTDETGTGSLVFATSPTLVTPILGTPTSGALTNCTADGTNKVGYRNIPAVADKTTSYSLTTADVGKVVGVGSGGSITIPNSTFAAGDAVLIFNNTSGDVTITCTITTAYIAGADADVASVTLSTRGVCNILFLSGTACVLTGNIA
jgi:hypothetical protein